MFLSESLPFAYKLQKDINEFIINNLYLCVKKNIIVYGNQGKVRFLNVRKRMFLTVFFTWSLPNLIFYTTRSSQWAIIIVYVLFILKASNDNWNWLYLRKILNLLGVLVHIWFGFNLKYLLRCPSQRHCVNLLYH